MSTLEKLVVGVLVVLVLGLAVFVGMKHGVWVGTLVYGLCFAIAAPSIWQRIKRGKPELRTMRGTLVSVAFRSPDQPNIDLIMLTDSGDRIFVRGKSLPHMRSIKKGGRARWSYYVWSGDGSRVSDLLEDFVEELPSSDDRPELGRENPGYKAFKKALEL